ncbi:hypothetical protein [Bradyrhizobium sp. STM 3557]|uniref:hypothetical protein n=1 Tax=Bradyrhizobium sp. STM 3557 TaxID=578920 RepID=UPI0038903207
MLARFLLGTVTAGAMIAPALAGSMTAEEARKFVAGKVFAFTCFDGTRGAGRILDDMGAAGAVQFSGSGPIRHVRLPGNTLQIRGENVCASLKGLPFEPCFNIDKKDDRSFRGSVSGLGFAYCDFQHQGGVTMLMARAVARPHGSRGPRAAAETSHTEIANRVETPRVDSAKIEPIKSEPDKTGSIKTEAAKTEAARAEAAKAETAKAESKPAEQSAPELRRSTD